MNPQQQPTYPSNGTNQPQYGWSNYPGYPPPNMPSDQPKMPTPGSPPQTPSQPIPVQPTAPGPDAFFITDTETPVCLLSEKTTRMAIIRKVVILMCQLALTVAFTAILVYQPQVNAFALAHGWLRWVAFAFVFILCIVIGYCEGLRRKWPMNIILVGFFTICGGFMVGLCSAFFEKDEVLLAFGICTVVCLALTIFATQTKWDFTVMWGMLFVCGIVWLIILIAAIYFQNRIVSLVFGCVGAIFFSVFLVYNIQRRVIGGANRKNAASPEEHILAALTVYIDIVFIFVNLLAIIAHSKRFASRIP